MSRDLDNRRREKSNPRELCLSRRSPTSGTTIQVLETLTSDRSRLLLGNGLGAGAV